MTQLSTRDYVREDRMMDLRRNGWTLEQIGREFRISRQRVHQILSRRERELRRKPSGPESAGDPGAAGG